MIQQLLQDGKQPSKNGTVMQAEGISCCQGKIVGMVKKDRKNGVKKVEEQWRQSSAQGEWAKATMELKRAVRQQFSIAGRRDPARRHEWKLPDGMDQNEWMAIQLEQPYVCFIQKPGGWNSNGRWAPWCKLCGKNGECKTHWTGKEHLYHARDPAGNARHPNTWQQPTQPFLDPCPI